MGKRYTEIRCSSELDVIIETVTFEGREHLVVPVVALVGNTVIQASNAPTPEYIPASVIEDSVNTWNGRPSIPLHPKSNGVAISANSPKVFDSLRMGFVFDATFSDNKLKVLAYLDTVRCNDLGGDAKLVIDKIQSGESIDVSVGAIVETEEQKGIALDGKEYGAIWVELRGDHLAFLPNSSGACDQNMGCGAPRIASKKEPDTMATENSNPPVIAVDRAAEPKKDFFSRLLTKFRPAVIFDDGNSDDELRQSLTDAIKAVDKAFDWICAVYPDSGVVIYMTYIMFPGQYYGTYQYWRRTYSVDDTGKKVTINNDAIEVQPKRVWETTDSGIEVTPQESSSIVGAESTSQSQSQSQSQLRAAECTCEKGDITMADHARKVVIDSLVAASKFKEEDRKSLEGMSEEGWKAVSGLVGEEKKAEEKTETIAPTVAAASSTSTPLTEEAVLSAFPDLNKIVTQHRNNEAARKSSLVTKLAALGKIPEDKLELKSLESLEELASVSGLEDPQSPVDFSMRGIPDPNAEARSLEAPVDGYMAALQKGNKVTTTPQAN